MDLETRASEGEVADGRISDVRSHAEQQAGEGGGAVRRCHECHVGERLASPQVECGEGGEARGERGR